MDRLEEKMSIAARSSRDARTTRAPILGAPLEGAKRTEVIGDCTLYLGDCRDILPAIEADALICDPPYGLGLGKHGGSNDERPRHLAKKGYAAYDDTPENYKLIVAPAIRDALAKTKRGMVFASPPMAWELPVPTAMGGVHLPSGVGRTPWGFAGVAHCLLYGRAPDLNKGHRPTVISSTERAPQEVDHPTVKPLKWMMWAVALGSRVGETVLDPFMGSGTTGVACVNLGRRFIGIELHEPYFDIARRRIEEAHSQPRLFGDAA